MSALGDHDANAVEHTLRKIRQNHTLVRCSIAGSRFDGLVVVEDVRFFDDILYFRLDQPAEVTRFLESPSQWTAQFEFTAADRTLQHFEVGRGLTIHGVFWFEAPDRIQRIQRRRDFRLKAPLGSVLEITRHRRPMRLGLIDISLGGVRCLVDAVSPKLRKTQLFKVGRTFKRARLVLPVEGTNGALIDIDKARILHAAQNPVTGAFEYGIMFLGLDGQTEKLLKELMYGLQRDYLRKRKTLIAP